MQIPAPIVCIFSFTAVATGLFAVGSAWAAILLYHLVLLVALGMRNNPGVHFRELCRGFSITWGLVLTLASACVGLAVYLTVFRLDPAGHHFAGKLAHVGLSGATIIPFALYVSTINPVLEEWYWRGNYADHRPGARWNDLFYSLFHIPIYLPFLSFSSMLVPVLLLLAAGMVWRTAARATRGLFAPIIGHATGDLFLMLAIGIILGRQG